ncbi:MAG: hypothetical protein ABSF71_36295 [Terriglobia bacterium]
MGTFLTACGKGMRIIGEHIIRLVAISGALTATLYSQQPGPPIACSGVLGDTACNLGLLPRDVSRSVPHPCNEGFQYKSFINFQCRDSYSMQDGLASGRLWPSPFASRQEGSTNCCRSDVNADRTGDSFVSTENDRGLGSLGFAGVNLWAQNQQSPPAPQPAQSSTEQGSPKHIFLVVPAFHVAYQKQFKPLSPREKFDEWLPGTYDLRGLGLYAFEAATLEHSSRDGFCGYGKHWGSYGKCFGSMELDANISSFFGDFLFPVIMHQDSRYFRRGEGSVGRRVLYAVSRVILTHADSGRTVFFSSALAGSVIAGAASNLYCPTQDRGFGPSLNRMGLDLGNTAFFNVAAEFWPDIEQKLGWVF